MLLFKLVRGTLKGVVGTYVDETLFACNSDFEDDAMKTEEKFESKERKYENFIFAGVQVEKINEGHLLHQERYAKD